MTIMDRSAAEFWWGKDKVPSNAVRFIHDPTRGNLYPGAEDKPYWEVVTWQDIFIKRKEEQEDNIELKRYSDSVIVKPCFIWVFENRNTNFFGGWYIYIKTLTRDYSINWQREKAPLMVLKAMQLFPCGVIPDTDNFEKWCEGFTKQYPHIGFKRNKYQGLKRCMCEIDYYGKLVNILN